MTMMIIYNYLYNEKGHLKVGNSESQWALGL